jgi:hypothetical protein
MAHLPPAVPSGPVADRARRPAGNFTASATRSKWVCSDSAAVSYSKVGDDPAAVGHDVLLVASPNSVPPILLQKPTKSRRCEPSKQRVMLCQNWGTHWQAATSAYFPNEWCLIRRVAA